MKALNSLGEISPRPLKRVIQKNVQDPLAEELLAGRIKDGDDVKVSVEGSALSLNGVPAEMKKAVLN